MMFVRFVAGTLGRMLNSSGQTICRLVANLINYIAILVFIYYSLSYLGVDTNAILASVGVIGIGVSMGARDLIADIFAGVSMIFEGEYQVGDIVDIDGYRGMVQEVGVRSTRLIGRGGNIKVIGNKDIKSVTNLTKLNSWVPITIKVDVNYPLRDVEEILGDTLPRIGQQCPQIISGPYYKGVLSVEMGFAVLSIIAECDEEDYHKVQRTLIREVLLALREKNVPVR
jgi:small conductance mechanosensitive channel